MLPLVIVRLQDVALLPELWRALEHMVAYDEGRKVRNPQWGTVIPAVQRVLGGTTEQVAPFAAAWSLMYAMIVRLDHLQDGDPVDDPLPVNGPSAQYNLLFSYYVLAAGLLDLLSPEHIPACRILRLRQFWTDMILRMAGGQQRDLAARTDDCLDSPLEYYQQLAQAKTGATFALAFGGTALLLTDDVQTIDALTLLGEIYGTLVQYSDDLVDAAAQPNPTLTLPQALTLVHPTQVPNLTGHTPTAFGSYLCGIYHEQAVRALAGLPADVQEGMLDLFARTFTPKPDGARDAA